MATWWEVWVDDVEPWQLMSGRDRARVLDGDAWSWVPAGAWLMRTSAEAQSRPWAERRKIVKVTRRKHRGAKGRELLSQRWEVGAREYWSREDAVEAARRARADGRSPRLVWVGRYRV